MNELLSNLFLFTTFTILQIVVLPVGPAGFLLTK
jgi:hypothetical protein